MSTRAGLEAHGPKAVAVATQTISTTLDIEPGQVFDHLAGWWAGWLAHPDYQAWVADRRYGPYEPGVFAPVAVGVFTHEEGIRGSESYIIDTPQGIIASIGWGERTLGEFAEIAPIWEGVSLPPFARYRQAVLPASPRGRATHTSAA